MRHGSLFSGGGGFDLAADIMGWKNVFHCEKDDFCQRVLEHYWPDAETFTDIKEFDARKYKGKIDIITGGFPCQPFSSAGQRKGTADDRYLWLDMLRIIREVRPRWVVGENVYGLVSWSDGLVFDQVQSDLEAEGYEVAAFVLPASGVDAPHQRYRVWIVGYHPCHAAGGKTEADPDADSFRRFISRPGLEAPQGRHTRKYRETVSLYPLQLAQAGADADGTGLERRAKHSRAAKGRKKADQYAAGFYQRDQWRNWPTQSPLCGRDDGLPSGLDGITVPKWRNQSIKLFGNAIVPRMALQLFATIEAFERSG